MKQRSNPGSQLPAPPEESLEERLRFETLLSEISARFVNLPAERIASEVEVAQSRICELLDLDRSSLWQWSEDEPGAMLLTHLRHPSGSLTPPGRMDAREYFPWTMQKCLGGATLIVEKLTDLPPEADRDRESFRVYGTRSTVVVPLSVGAGPVMGLLTFAFMREERHWTETTVMGFQLIAQVFANAFARRQAEQILNDRLRFEQMFSNLSARFMTVPPGRVDEEINAALRQLLDFFRVERCGLLEFQPSRTLVRITHAASSEGVEPISGEINLAELFPWSYGKLVRGELVSLRGVDDYPADACDDKRSHEAMGLKSALNIPLSVDGTVSRTIAVNTTRRNLAWPDAYIPRLRLLGELFANALERRENRLRLEEQLRFEMLLAEISGRFVNLRPDQVDGEIVEAQRRVCECLGLDLSALWQWSAYAPRLLTLTHLHRPPGGPPTPGPMLAQEHFPWCQQQLEAGRIIAVSSMEDLPAEAARDREVWASFGVKTTLTFPLSPGGGPPIGALSFNTLLAERDWPEPLINRLQLVAQIFTNALIRKQAETALQESEARLSLATETVDAGLWILEVDTKKVWVSPKSRELFHFAPDEEIRYERYFRVIHPEDRNRVHQEVQKALRSGERLRCDYRILLPDGTVRWITSRGQGFLKSTGEPERMMGLSLDITERKEMELKLSESETTLDSLVNSTSDLIWSVDPEHFGILVFNRGLSEYFRQNHGIHVKPGMRPEDLLPADYAREWSRFYRQALEKGSFTTEYSTSGGDRTLRLNINRLKSGDRVYGASVFAQDITELVRQEAQLKEQLQEIEALRERLERENVYLREEVKLLVDQTNIVGQSAVMKKVLTQAEQVARTGSTVLLLGETGTGKELLARAIHSLSPRKDRPLVTVNCASLPPTLIESELFGREKGAYTGALTRMIGRFEIADKSTLFLDEIGELPLELQGKLLRVLEEGTFQRLGSPKPLHVDVRIIAATNRDIEQDVKDGRFRRDLFYRLNVFPIVIPPLRERPEDIPPLVRAIVKEFQKRMGKEIDSIPKKTMDALQSYSWPGNVRELRNLIEHAMIVSRGKTLEVRVPKGASLDFEISGNLQDMERMHVMAVLERTGWRIAGAGGAAEILGLKRTTLQARMKKLGIRRSNKPMPN